MTDSPEVFHWTGRSSGELQAPSDLLDGDSVTSGGQLNVGPRFSSCKTNSVRRPVPRVPTGPRCLSSPPPPRRDFLRHSPLVTGVSPSCFLGRMGKRIVTEREAI